MPDLIVDIPVHAVVHVMADGATAEEALAEAVALVREYLSHGRDLNLFPGNLPATLWVADPQPIGYYNLTTKRTVTATQPRPPNTSSTRSATT